MLNQQDMTKEARIVLNELTSAPARAEDIAYNTRMSDARCELILTQLVMAGLSIYQFGCYKRLH